jgi:hypothetical protein
MSPANNVAVLILIVFSDVFIRFDMVAFKTSKFPVLVLDANTLDADILVLSRLVTSIFDELILDEVTLVKLTEVDTNEETVKFVILAFVLDKESDEIIGEFKLLILAFVTFKDDVVIREAKRLVLIILPKVDNVDTRLLDVKFVTIIFSLDVLLKVAPAKIKLPILAISTTKLLVEINPEISDDVVILVFTILPKVVLVILAFELDKLETYKLELEILRVFMSVLIKFGIVAEILDKLPVLINVV